MNVTLFAVVAAVAIVAVVIALNIYRRNQQLERQLAPAAPRKTAEEQQDERLDRQLEAVMREAVKFSASRVMGRGEYELFRAALNVTGQPIPPAF